MTVVPFKRGGGEPPREAPHIDAASLKMLWDAQIEARVLRDYETDPQRRDDLTRLVGMLDRLAARFDLPKGAA